MSLSIAKTQTQARLTPERGSYPLSPSLKTGGLGGRGAASPGRGKGAQSPYKRWGVGWGMSGGQRRVGRPSQLPSTNPLRSLLCLPLPISC